MTMMDDPLGIELAGVRLRNPVIAAAGTCGYGTEFDRVLPASALGAITLGARILYRSESRSQRKVPGIYFQGWKCILT